MHLTDLLNSDIIGTTLPSEAGSITITGLTDDSRKVRSGFLFFAISGSKNDGRAYCQQAMEAGAAVIVTDDRKLDKDLEQIRDAGTPVITLANPRRALALVAARLWPRQPSMIAAVTGTNGKTSTTEFLRQIWKRVTWDAASLGTLGVQGTDTRKLRGKMIDLPSLTTPDAISLHSN
ncbi:MAG: Mur ligase domain-containing protein, partial [Alphaproteobacteria bacterium]